ncbi:hypothetical protein [Coleofasciculus sp. G2-EDA-02]|uniref:hypothetical protein n=1 Tax=Coleofasciculus sp. G2-EDA-02 TaxID=3069529 RepID=UPI0032FB6347
MFDLTFSIEFSRAHCVAICAGLVPLNLLLTLQTMILTGLQRSQRQVRLAAVLAYIPAGVMVLHVWTWWMIGVVMAPTFILLGLACICAGINVWASLSPQTMASLLRGGWFWVMEHIRHSDKRRDSVVVP